jgi:hypothetical protein
MSAPASEQRGNDGPLLYAPRKVRRLQRASTEESTVTSAAPTVPVITPPRTLPATVAPRTLPATVAPRTLPATVAPPPLVTTAPPKPPVTSAPPTAPELEPARAVVPRQHRLQPFEGDAAIKDLRGRLSRDPDLALQPPGRAEETSAGQWIGGWSFALIMAAIAIGTVLMVSPLREVFRAESSARPAAPATSQKRSAEEPLAFVLSLDNARGTNQLADSQIVRLEWTHKDERPEAPEPVDPPQPMRSLDAETLAVLEYFLKNGDIVSARILLKRAAGNGNGQAALELGMTYDPMFLADRGVRGFAPDPAEARFWYERAMARGSAEASRNLERLKGMEK